jgi:hypothetical protein
MSNSEVRAWYLARVVDIPKLNEEPATSASVPCIGDEAMTNFSSIAKYKLESSLPHFREWP